MCFYSFCISELELKCILVLLDGQKQESTEYLLTHVTFQYLTFSTITYPTKVRDSLLHHFLPCVNIYSSFLLTFNPMFFLLFILCNI